MLKTGKLQYMKYFREMIYKHWGMACKAWKLYRMGRKITNDPDTLNYTDIALTSIVDHVQPLFTTSEAAKTIPSRKSREHRKQLSS